MANRSHGRRMDKGWSFITRKSQAMTADATFVGGGLSPAEVIFGPQATVLRMLLNYTIAPTSAPTAGDIAEVGVAIGVFSTDASTLGASAVPDPTSEGQYPWLYWAVHEFSYADTSADPSSAAGSVRVTADIRSIRKIKQSETLGVVFQYADVVGAPPLSLHMSPTRVLFGS